MEEVAVFRPIRCYATGDEDGLYAVVEFIPEGSDAESYEMYFDADPDSLVPLFVVEDSKEAIVVIRKTDEGHLVADLLLRSPDGENEKHILPFTIMDGRWWPERWIGVE